MRKLLSILTLIFCLSLSAAALPFDKYSVNREDLPESAQQFLSTHFPKDKVSMIKIDKHLLKKTDYDVKLVNGTEIEFNNKGEWTSVDCKTRAVPEKLIMSTIRRYLDKNYPKSKVVEIKKKIHVYRLELADGTELEFDRLGIFKSAKQKD